MLFGYIEDLLRDMALQAALSFAVIGLIVVALILVIDRGE